MPALSGVLLAGKPEGRVPFNPFDQLVQDLRDTLGPSSGIDSAGIDPKDLQDLMTDYASNPSDWAKYAFEDYSRSYTRNLVDEGNGKANLLIAVWTPGRTSPIHDHADAHCVMKVLKGSLKETLYDWPNPKLLIKGQPSPLRITQERIFKVNEVTYMSDKLGLHSVGNPDPKNAAVSLHLYTPPNAAVYGCHIFDERTGKASHVTQCNYFSRLGMRLPG